MAERLDPAPIREPLILRTPLTPTEVWVRWLEQLRRAVQAGGTGGGGGTVPVSGITPVTSPRLLGRYSPGSGPGQEISVGTGLLLDATGVLTNTGVPGAPPLVTLRTSTDGGHTWSYGRQRSAGKIGAYPQVVHWRQLGQSRSMAFEVSCSDPVPIAWLGATVEAG